MFYIILELTALIITFYFIHYPFILDTCDLISTSLNSKIAGRAFIQCIDTIVESTIDPFALVRKLYSKEVISKDVYKRVRDKESRDTCWEYLEKIFDDIQDYIKHDANVFVTFLDVLIDLSRKDLADIIKTKYKGILHYVILSQFIFF